jgi:hypothetical protein
MHENGAATASMRGVKLEVIDKAEFVLVLQLPFHGQPRCASAALIRGHALMALP